MAGYKALSFRFQLHTLDLCTNNVLPPPNLSMLPPTTPHWYHKKQKLAFLCKESFLCIFGQLIISCYQKNSAFHANPSGFSSYYMACVFSYLPTKAFADTSPPLPPRHQISCAQYFPLSQHRTHQNTLAARPPCYVVHVRALGPGSGKWIWGLTGWKEQEV